MHMAQTSDVFLVYTDSPTAQQASLGWCECEQWVRHHHPQQRAHGGRARSISAPHWVCCRAWIGCVLCGC